jgi:cysteinyl-tRNA synthetase
MKVPFNLYNTLSRTVEPFSPLQEDKVTIYTCGPTVYGDSHIGNYRTFIFEDLLVKSLRHFGYPVERVMNITDVGHLTSDADEGEDKLELGAKRENSTAWEVAQKYTERFLQDLTVLQIETPHSLIKATDTISDQINLIKVLEEKGFTYLTSDGVYFDSSKVPDYGKLAQLDIQGLEAGARVAMGEKRQPTDFALWKFSPINTHRDMEWDSPWGKGFPGWHLECSAIIQKAFGGTIDIHCGGVDHIPVHHTNEIAQSESAYNRSLAHYWCHAEFLLVDGGKMAKSLGNLYTLADLQQADIDPLAFKLFVYAASYRSKLNFSWDAVTAAHHTLHRLRRAYHDPGKGESEAIEPFQEEFTAALADDLNTAQALAVVWKTLDAPLTQAARQNFLDEVDTIFGLNLAETPQSLVIPDHVNELLEQRKKARAEKDWATADALRQQIEDAGFGVSDTPEGTQLM